MTYDASASTVKKVLMSVAVPAATAATTSAAGIVELATADEMQTGSDTTRAATVIGVAKHQGVCKGWCRFEQIGTHSIKDSYNVSSVADAGVGGTKINWATNFANANYCTIATASADEVAFATVEQTSIATSFCYVYCFDASGSAIDCTGVSIAAFGDRT
jgi:hypothetical protein